MVAIAKKGLGQMSKGSGPEGLRSALPAAELRERHIVACIFCIESKLNDRFQDTAYRSVNRNTVTGFMAGVLQRFESNTDVDWMRAIS